MNLYEPLDNFFANFTDFEYLKVLTSSLLKLNFLLVLSILEI